MREAVTVEPQVIGWQGRSHWPCDMPLPKAEISAFSREDTRAGSPLPSQGPLRTYACARQVEVSYHRVDLEGSSQGNGTFRPNLHGSAAEAAQRAAVSCCTGQTQPSLTTAAATHVPS
jgi:hypothetical protein